LDDKSRILRYVKMTDSCWLWRAYTDKKGYGRCRLNNRNGVKSHRAVYEILVGPIPDGLCVLHKCDVRNCVNPEHLFLGTHLDNAQDRDSKGRCRAGIRKKEQTHCIHGHEFTVENTIIRANGTRRCRTCQNKRKRRSYYKSKEKV
jgi:hypothetical protein